ncbi:MAG: YybH family protein [Bryobacteraceae bacterium]
MPTRSPDPNCREPLYHIAMSLRFGIILAFVASATASLPAQTSDAKIMIEKILTAQVQAWNRGDIPKFVTVYAEDCTFVGKQVLQGRSNLLARYQKTYPSPESMAKLTFRNLTVRRLDEEVATAVGEWHIDRPVVSGGPTGGIFSLVLQLSEGTWQIVLDHTA